MLNIFVLRSADQDENSRWAMETEREAFMEDSSPCPCIPFNSNFPLFLRMAYRGWSRFFWLAICVSICGRAIGRSSRRSVKEREKEKEMWEKE